MNPNDDALLNDNDSSFDEKDDELLQGFGLSDDETEETPDGDDDDFANYNDEE